MRPVGHQKGAAGAGFWLHSTGMVPTHALGAFCCCMSGFAELQRLQQAVYCVLAAAVSWLFSCAGGLSGVAGRVHSLCTVSMIHTDRTVCVGLTWVLFGRCTTKISGNC